jgi:hypothetical protein
MDVYARRRLVAAGGGVLVLILIIFGISQCGDDDEGTPITPIGATGGATLTAVSKDDYISEADSICGERNAQLIAAEEDLAGDPAELAAERYDIVNNELSDLQGLAPPDEDADLLDGFLSALDDRVAALRQQRLATERQDDTALAEAQTTLDAADIEIATAAQEFGFEVCGTSDTGSGTDTGADAGGTAPAPATPTPTTPTTPAPTTPPDTGDGDSGGVGPG